MCASPVEVGILGFAHGHVNAYCERWRASGDFGVQVSAGWDHDAGRLAEAARQHGVRPCESAKELLELKSISAVVIAAETSLHAELVELAASAGKAIILQKPLALTMDEADRIVEAVGARTCLSRWPGKCGPIRRTWKCGRWCATGRSAGS